MKIILGLANFQKNYHKKKLYNLSLSQKIKILKNLEKNKIFEVDTSPDYGNAESLVGKYCNNNILVHSKLRAIPKIKDKVKLQQWVEKNIFETLKKIKKKRIKTYFFHGPNDLLKYEGQICYDFLNKYKDRGYFDKIGISIYEPKQYIKVLKKFDIDCIQAPANVFDNRFIEKNLSNFFMKRKIILFARSLFLQGILVDENLSFKIKDNRAKSLLLKWYNYINNNDLSMIEECLNFAKMKKIKNLVIGMNSLGEIKKIINHKFHKNVNLIKFKSEYAKLIDPRFWSSNV